MERVERGFCLCQLRKVSLVLSKLDFSAHVLEVLEMERLLKMLPKKKRRRRDAARAMIPMALSAGGGGGLTLSSAV